MKKRYIYRLILYNLALSMVAICAISCVNKENELDDFIFKTAYTKSDTIDFNLLECLNETNKKIVSLSSMVFHQTKDVKTLQLLLKIKRDHQKMDAELKKLAEDNLILLPRLVYDLNLNPDSLKGKNANDYLSRVLENEIENQAQVLEQIEKMAQNIDLRLFAVKSKKIVLTNNKVLKNTLNI